MPPWRRVFRRRKTFEGWLTVVTTIGNAKAIALFVEKGRRPPLPRLTVELPDQVARQWGETPDAVGRHVMEDAAIEGYRAGRLSHRQVGEMLALDYWQAEAFLKERGYR